MGRTKRFQVTLKPEDDVALTVRADQDGLPRATLAAQILHQGLARTRDSAAFRAALGKDDAQQKEDVA